MNFVPNINIKETVLSNMTSFHLKRNTYQKSVFSLLLGEYDKSGNYTVESTLDNFLYFNEDLKEEKYSQKLDESTLLLMSYFENNPTHFILGGFVTGFDSEDISTLKSQIERLYKDEIELRNNFQNDLLFFLNFDELETKKDFSLKVYTWYTDNYFKNVVINECKYKVIKTSYNSNLNLKILNENTNNNSNSSKLSYEFVDSDSKCKNKNNEENQDSLIKTRIMELISFLSQKEKLSHKEYNEVINVISVLKRKIDSDKRSCKNNSEILKSLAGSLMSQIKLTDEINEMFI